MSGTERDLFRGCVDDCDASRAEFSENDMSVLLRRYSDENGARGSSFPAISHEAVGR